MAKTTFTVNQKYIDANPDFVFNGGKLGDEIKIEKSELALYADSEKENPEPTKAADEKTKTVDSSTDNGVNPFIIDFEKAITEGRIHPEFVLQSPVIVGFCANVYMGHMRINAPTQAFPEMSDEDINALAQNEAGVAIAGRIVAAAKAINAEKNKPAPLTQEDLEAAAYQRLVDRYGKDFVTAKKGKDTKYFTRQAWLNLPKGRYGWEEVTKAMPEVPKGK